MFFFLLQPIRGLSHSTYLYLHGVAKSCAPQDLCSDCVRSGSNVFIWLLRPKKAQSASLLTLMCDIEMLPFIFLLVVSRYCWSKRELGH